MEAIIPLNSGTENSYYIKTKIVRWDNRKRKHVEMSILYVGWEPINGWDRILQMHSVLTFWQSRVLAPRSRNILQNVFFSGI